MAQRILIVEDEQGIVDNVAYALNTEGFATAACKTGAEALKALARGNVDLIVLDIGLPDRTGPASSCARRSARRRACRSYS